MYFYCTTKINNYYKVGIAESTTRIKGRLSSYRATFPKTKIKFFSEIIGARELENSFKNKFAEFRIGSSECYNLKFDIIYKHFLKFQHKQGLLHQYWDGWTLFLSDYYFTKSVPDGEYNLSQRSFFNILHDFVPVASLDYKKNSEDKKGNHVIIANYLDIEKANLENFHRKYNKLLEEKYYNQPLGYANDQLKDFYKKNFKLKKIIKAKNIQYAEAPIGQIIFETLEKNYKKMVKGYPKDKLGSNFRDKPEQREIYTKSLYYNRKVSRFFKETYNISQVQKGLREILSSKKFDHSFDYSLIHLIIDTMSLGIKPSTSYTKNYNEYVVKIRNILETTAKNVQKEIETAHKKYRLMEPLKRREHINYKEKSDIERGAAIIDFLKLAKKKKKIK